MPTTFAVLGDGAWGTGLAFWRGRCGHGQLVCWTYFLTGGAGGPSGSG
jgi:hypothetical protein